MPKVCIIIPCFNEELRLNCNCFLDFLKANPTLSFCFINDGSTDRTLTILNNFKSNNEDRIFVLDLLKNEGKAQAVRHGMLQILNREDFEYIGFWDADLSAPLEEVNSLIFAFTGNKKIKLAIGSRVKRLGANISRRPFRHLLGRIFSTFSGFILKLPVYDSQCGAKLFNRDIIVPIFEKPFMTTWLFDIEILARLRNYYGIKETLDMVIEVPLKDWKEVEGSKIKFKHFINVPFQLLEINKIYNKL